MVGPAQGVWDGSPPVGSRGKAPVVSLGDSLPEAEAKYEISVQFETFPVKNFGFNENRNRAQTIFCKHTIQKI